MIWANSHTLILPWGQDTFASCLLRLRYLNPFCSGTLKASQFLVLAREERSQVRKKNRYTTVGGHSSSIKKPWKLPLWQWREKKGKAWESFFYLLFLLKNWDLLTICFLEHPKDDQKTCGFWHQPDCASETSQWRKEPNYTWTVSDPLFFIRRNAWETMSCHRKNPPTASAKG